MFNLHPVQVRHTAGLRRMQILASESILRGRECFNIVLTANLEVCV